MSPAQPRAGSSKNRRTFWLKQLHQWHWMSSALALIGLLLFTITGITLNHAADIESSPKVTETSATLPQPLLAAIRADDAPDSKKPLPPKIAAWLEKTLPIHADGIAEWSADEVYLALPQPGGDGWVSIDRTSGAVASEHTDRGWISWLNDLHKGRNVGVVWRWFIDVFAGACLVFALTGLILLQLHARRRPSTWPIVAAGLAIPAILATWFLH